MILFHIKTILCFADGPLASL